MQSTRKSAKSFIVETAFGCSASVAEAKLISAIGGWSQEYFDQIAPIPKSLSTEMLKGIRGCLLKMQAVFRDNSVFSNVSMIHMLDRICRTLPELGVPDETMQKFKSLSPP